MDFNNTPNNGQPYSAALSIGAHPFKQVKDLVDVFFFDAYAIVCGPPIVIRLTQPILEKLGFPAERIILSLEMRMKCGIGKCGRCNIGGKFVCKHGPVFTYEQLMNMPQEY